MERYNQFYDLDLFPVCTVYVYYMYCTRLLLIIIKIIENSGAGCILWPGKKALSRDLYFSLYPFPAAMFFAIFHSYAAGIAHIISSFKR